MTEHIMTGLTLILVLGITSQLIGWYTRIPSIVILIGVGLLAGPVLGWIHPEQIFGELLNPFISLSVAIILFEGGLILKLEEIKRTVGVVTKLITLGVLITWIIASLGSYWILGLDWPLAILLAAILVISGPTVIMPLLRHLRLRGDIGPILKWEGILIDPIGATLALLVFGVILAGGPEEAILQGLTTLGVIILVGIILGSVGGLLITQLLRRYLVPDFLQIPVVLSIVTGAFLLSDLIQPDSGLLTAVIMGAFLANQKQVSVEHIVDFKETLGLILISLLFITLSATIDIEAILPLAGGILLFSLLLIVLARPLSVFTAGWGSKLKWRDKVLLSAIAPRGIVSASIASVFGFRLAERGFAGAEILLPITFTVIILSVISSSALATIATRAFKISKPNPQGIIFIGGQNWVRDIATILEELDIRTFIIDQSKSNVAYARRKKLQAYYGNALSPGITDNLGFSDYGRVLSMTSNDNVNHLAALHFSKEFGSANTYLLATDDLPASKKAGHFKSNLPGRVLFSDKANYETINDLYLNGAKIKTTNLTSDYPFEAFVSDNKKAIPLFLVSESEELTVITTETDMENKADTTLIALIP
ncbi:MAG: cation:proton antiporter [Dehalogenimonas sp.]